MSSVLYMLGRWAFRARRRTVALWILVLLLLIAGAGILGTGTNNTFSIPGTESQNALESLARTFPQVSGTSAQMIVMAPHGQSVRDSAIESSVARSITAIEAIPQVSSVTSPYSSTSSPNISSDASSALVPVQLSVVQSEVTPSTKDALQTAGTKLLSTLPPGSQVAVGGQVFSQSPASISATELVGILVALVVLILTFASVVAAGIPLITALLGVSLSLSAILAATRFATISSTAPLLSLMLGLAVGIDYALFILSRHQDQLKQGVPPEESAARSVATAGSAVVFAAITVIIALLGLSVARIPFLTTMGICAAIAVAIAVLVSLTLIPALLGFAGMRVVPKRYRIAMARQEPIVDPASDLEGAAVRDDGPSADSGSSGDPGAGADSAGDPNGGEESVETPMHEAVEPPSAPPPARGFFLGWVRAVTKIPVVTIVATVVLLGLATLPAAQLRLALPDAGSLDENDPARITYDLIALHFGPGYNGPLIVTGSIIQSNDPVGLMNDLAAKIATIPGVAAVPLSTPNQTGDTGIVQVIPTGAPDSQETQDLVATIRSMHDALEKEFGVDLSVTGFTAAGIDISARLADALLPFGLLVVGLSLVLLAMVFRSIAVPVTAALGYLLSVGVAFGVTSLVFEHGFLAGPLRVASLGSVISFMPIILMGVLFGLAMDYEVFLVSRMREEYVHHGHARQAVEHGFVGSAKVVTAAAIIMFAVFAAFIPSGDSSIQPIALGLAVGVAVDAFIVRMTLIPAVLVLLGVNAWWLPRWLDRILPSFDVEGEGLTKELEAMEWPEPGDRIAIAAEGVGVANGDSTLLEDLSVIVPVGDILLVDGRARTGKTAALFAIGGRLAITSGRLKVAGFILPTRAPAVRACVSTVRIRFSSDPVEDLADAVSTRPAVLVVDDLDAVRAATRADVATILAHAYRDAIARGKPLTMVVSCEDPDAINGLLPEESARTLITLSRGSVAEPALVSS